MPAMQRMGQSFAVAGRSVTGDPLSRKRWTPVSDLEFVGCDSLRMTLREYEEYPEDGRRIEFFDSEARRAWMMREAAGPHHEDPGGTLGQLVREIAMLRGSPIKCRGSAGLRLLDADSGHLRVMEPDEMLFLHPHRLPQPGTDYLMVRDRELPDVVLEVDHTTDVRRGKLKLYEEWGFPEIWVETPDAYSRSRPGNLEPGLRIYVLEGGRYTESADGRAFPGWRADEIHRALNEFVISEETSAVLARVGQALGEREGTGPDDDPLLGAHRAEGRAEGRAGLVQAMLESRSVAVPADFPARRHFAALGMASDKTIIAAAASANDFADFLAPSRIAPNRSPDAGGSKAPFGARVALGPPRVKPVPQPIRMAPPARIADLWSASRGSAKPAPMTLLPADVGTAHPARLEWRDRSSLPPTRAAPRPGGDQNR